jgi:O-antigen/teichoic acid export membrane protein
MLLTGNLMGAAVGGAFFLTASRLLSLEDMGRYAVAISLQWVVFGLIGHGLGIATLRVARDRVAAGDHKGANGVVAYAVLTAASVAIIAAAAAYSLIELTGMTTFSPGRVALAILWAGCRAVLECTRSGLFAEQRFARSALLSVASGAAGLSALVLTLLTGEFTVVRLLGAHVLGMLGGAAAGFVLLLPLARHGVQLRGAFEVFRYARWPALSEGTRTLQVNLGAPILVAIAGAAEAGLFGMARYPAFLFDVAAVTLYQYWLTKAVHVPRKAELLSYVRRQMRFAGLVGVGVVAAALVAQPLLPLLGPNFANVGLLFVLCSIDFALVLLVRPIESAYHGMARPRLELMQRCVALPTLLVAALVLVERWGAVGMVGAHIMASLVSVIVGTALVHRVLGEPDTMRHASGA